MKKSKYILGILLLITAFAFTTCTSSKKASSTYAVKKVTNEEIEKTIPIPDDIIIDDIKIEKDEMIFIVSYRGCKNQVFELFWNGGFAKSIPPQAGVVLHTDYKSGAECNEAINKREIKFSIKELRYPNGNEVQINIYKSSFSYKY